MMIAALRSALSSLSSNDSQSLDKWNDELERKLLLQQHDGHGGCPPPFDDEELDDTTRIVANELHLSLLKTVHNAVRDCCASSLPSLFIIKPIYNDDDVEVDKLTNEIVDNIQFINNINSTTTSTPMITSIYWKHLAILLRATGLFMRWITQTDSSTSSVMLPSSLMSSIGRLKSKGTLLLYSKLLEMDILTSSSMTNDMDIPRFASICLFRATYGNGELTVLARQNFVDSIDGCACLMRALSRGDQPVARLFSIVRNIHHLISACPESITKMERSLVTLMTESADEEGSGGNNNVTDANPNCYLTMSIVATMAWACRSEPPFSEASADDRRPELVLEILRTMYALEGRTNPSYETMTQIGILLCELLRHSSADTRLYEIKLAVVSLLLNAPTEYSTYLLANGGIEPLVDILSYQSSLVVVERTGSSNNDAAAIVPILLTLQRLVESNELVLKVVKDAVFPLNAEATFEQMVSDEMTKTAQQSEGGKVNAKNMAPLDAPKGTLRWKLICLMTWTESNVKRAACELLWALCDGNATQFVLRVGFGNAVYFLGIKGCVSLPAGVEM